MAKGGRVAPAIGLVALAVGAPALAAAPGALARSSLSSVLAEGQRGRFAWQITARTAQEIGQPPKPGYCIDFGARVRPARKDSGAGICLNPGDPRADGNKGVIVDAAGTAVGSVGVRAVFAIVDPRADRVVITLNNGRVLRAPTHALPQRLHAGARVAWVVQGVKRNALTSPHDEPGHVVAYDAAGHVVGTS